MVRTHLERYLEQAKIDEIREEWEARGYKSTGQKELDGVTVDLVMRRGDETVVFEVRTAKSLARSRKAAAKLGELAANHPNTTFHLVVANPPREKEIRIDGLEGAIFQHILENTPPELDELSSHTSVESLDDIEVWGVQIHPGRIQARGSGVVSVRLQYGSDAELEGADGAVSHEAFPLEFAVTLDPDLGITDVGLLKVDTSSFYE